MLVCSFLLVGLSLVSSIASPVDLVQIDLSQTAPFEHYWKRSFGSGHATLTLRPDWQGQLKQAVEDLGLAGIRHHGIFDDDMNVVTLPRTYNFTLVEASWKFQVAYNVTPIVELSFMPAILANCTWKAPTGGHVVNPGHQPCLTGMQYKMINMPPTSFDDWYDLVRALVLHAVRIFGLKEVERWKFECWNELWGMPFPSLYMPLFNASASAVKSVSPSLKIGGPATARLKDLAEFVQQAKKLDIPFDFVSTHMYPTDPFCPTKSDWGPDCLPSNVREAKEAIASAGVPLYLTEYNVGCCIGYPQHDVSGAAAFAYRAVGALDGITDVLSWWTFSDIFEEQTAVNQHTEFMNVYGLMTVSGIPKPGWRAFQLLHQHAGTTRVKANVTESVFSCGSPSKCATESDTNMAGFDVGAEIPGIDEPGCCDACLADPDCAFWTFVSANSTCRLKSSDAGRTSSSGITSGSASPPPPPSSKSTKISALVTLPGNPEGVGKGLEGMAIFLSHWRVNESDAPSRTVNISFVNHESFRNYAQSVTEYRIDANHANPYAKWVSLGSPGKPSPEQVSELIEASQVLPKIYAVGTSGTLPPVNLPANSAVLLVLRGGERVEPTKSDVESSVL